MSENSLAEASQSGDVSKVLSYLSTVGSDVGVACQAKGSMGKSPLHLAGSYGQTLVTKELLKAGSNPLQLNDIGRTVLHETCIGGHPECLALLLEKTTITDTRDKDGMTAVLLAAYHGELDCLELLANKGSSLTSSDNKGRQVAHLATLRNHPQIIQFLYDKQVDLECRCDLGKTPMHYAAQYGALSCLECLRQCDCDITAVDSSGNTAAHHAAAANKLDSLRFLIKQGISLEAMQNDGKMPAHMAASSGSVSCLHWMLEKGFDPNLPDNSGSTLGHYAALRGKANCLHCFLQHGGDTRITNCRHETILESARKSGHYSLAEKAVQNEVTCPACLKEMKRAEWQRSHPSSLIKRNISSITAAAYRPLIPGDDTKNVQPNTSRSDYAVSVRSAKSTKNKSPNRDLTTQYFGEHLDPNELFTYKCQS